MDGESIRLVERSWGETKCGCCPPVSVWPGIHPHGYFSKEAGDLRASGSNVFVSKVCSSVHIEAF